jgi:hypothetical protein
MQMNVDPVIAKVVEDLNPRRSTFNPLDSDFPEPEPEPGTIEGGPTTRLPGLEADFAPVPPAAPQKPAPPKAPAEPKDEEVVELTGQEAEDFEAFQRMRQAHRTFENFCKAHPDYRPSPVNGEIFEAWTKSKGLPPTIEAVTPAILEQFYLECREYIETTTNTVPLPEPGQQPRVIFVEKPKPIATGLPASSHPGPAPEGEMTEADLRQRIANMPLEQARAFMQALMRQANRGNQR